MSKHILFLVHGMGVHENNKWADDVRQKLNDTAAEFRYFQNTKLEEKVKFVPISYDHIFVDILEQWKKNSSNLLEFAKESDLKLDLGEDILKELENSASTDKNFLWSHVADVLIYRFSSHYRALIRNHIIHSMAKVIDTEIDETGDARVSVLAHSLGTSVIHDSLHLLGSVKWGGYPNLLGPTHWRYQSIIMLANTSRLLQTDIQAYKSVVRPGANLDPISYCYNYLNFRHEYDPVPFPRMFEPTGWGSSYYSKTIRHFRDWNIHDFEHYLDDPRVHIPILKLLAGFKSVTSEEEQQRVNDYPQFAGNFNWVASIKSKFSELSELNTHLGQEPSVLDWVKALIKLYGIISEMQKILKDIPIDQIRGKKQ